MKGVALAIWLGLSLCAEQELNPYFIGIIGAVVVILADDKKTGDK
jgi:hypothetical protein